MNRHLANWNGGAFCGKTDGIVVNDSTNDCEMCLYAHEQFVRVCSDGNCRHRRCTHAPDIKLNENLYKHGTMERYTYCKLGINYHGEKMLAAPGTEPTCDECLRVGRMKRGIFPYARRAGHVIYRHDGLYLKRDGSLKRDDPYLQPPLPMRYEIHELYVADNGADRIVVVGFRREEDRDRIFDAMVVGGYCGHTKKSWIRSIDQ
jgi:hypothetical protein